MRTTRLAVRCCLAVLAILLLAPGLRAEEPIKAMAFFEEPLTLHAVPGKQRHLLVVLPQPGITSPVYALKGMLSYEGVEGAAFLQMNNDFGAEGVYFTKSLADSGPLAKISGSSGWRPFILPFHANKGRQASGEFLAPGEVTLSLHLPGAGSVSIRDVGLYQYASGENPLAQPTTRMSFMQIVAAVILVVLVLMFVLKVFRPDA